LNSYGSQGAHGKESLDQPDEDRKLTNLHEQKRACKASLTEISDSVREPGGNRKRDRAYGEGLEATDGTGQSRIRSDRSTRQDGVRVRQEKK